MTSPHRPTGDNKRKEMESGNKKNSVTITMVVTGYDTSLPADEVKGLLSEHFSSCGKITKVYIPTEVKEQSRNKYAFVDITVDITGENTDLGEKAKDVEEKAKADTKLKALQLNGSNCQGRNLVVKAMPYNVNFKFSPEGYVQSVELQEEKLATPNLQVVMVSGFDVNLEEYNVSDPLLKYFSDCGEIRSIHVYRDPKTGLLYKTASLFIFGLRDEVGAKSWALNGKDMGGWNAEVVPFGEPKEIDSYTFYR